MPIVSNLLRNSESSDSARLPNLTEYYRVDAEYQKILREHYPGTVLEGQDLLKRVAAVVGLQLPKLKEKE